MGIERETSTSETLEKKETRSRCVTTKSQLWLSTMALACARLASLETMPQGRLPLHRGKAPTRGCDGGHGPEGLLRGGRGAVQEGDPHPQVPDRARHRDQLGRHGEDLAPHLLQRAPRRP